MLTLSSISKKNFNTWSNSKKNIEAIIDFTALPHVITEVEEYYNNEYNSNQRFNEFGLTGCLPTIEYDW